MSSSKSGLSNKPPVKTDVSPKRKEKFNYREAAVAIAIIIIVVTGTLLLTVGFRNNYERDLEKATDEANATKAEFTTKLSELATTAADRQKELDTREAKLNTREKALEAREEALGTERAEFYASQARVKELCELLLIELTPKE